MYATMDLDDVLGAGEQVLLSALTDIMYELIDDVTLGVCFEVHRSCKMGTIFIGDTDESSEIEHGIVNRPGLDVFGQVPMKKQLECVCPNCQRHLAAPRFAPHLEKCMGMGRNSSRIARRRRICNADRTLKRDSEESGDDDNDNDWSLTDRRVKKIKKDKNCNSPRRGKFFKSKHDDNGDSTVTAETTAAACESMTLEEKKALLLQTCGVISEHTRKMCTRSHKCPQHSDEQRRIVRMYLLGHAHAYDGDDVQVDIDGYDDGDTHSLRASLQWEASSNPSPADSTSTNNSTSSRKRPSSKASTSKQQTAKKKKTLTKLMSKESVAANQFDFP